MPGNLFDVASDLVLEPVDLVLKINPITYSMRAFIPIIQQVMIQKVISRNALSRMIGMNKFTLLRKLKHDNEFSYGEMRKICHALEIDYLCACFAIDICKDWRMYFSNNVRISHAIATGLTGELTQICDGDIDDIKPSIVERQSKKMASDLKEHQDRMRAYEDRALGFS